MPKYLATPLAMTMNHFATSHGFRIGTASDYEERMTIEVDAECIKQALSHTWKAFQNIGDGWMTPDDGRSLMVGDLIKITDGRSVEIHVIKMIGFEKIEGFAPSE